MDKIVALETINAELKAALENLGNQITTENEGRPAVTPRITSTQAHGTGGPDEDLCNESQERADLLLAFTLALNIELVKALHSVDDLCSRGVSHTWIRRVVRAAIAKATSHE